MVTYLIFHNMSKQAINQFEYHMNKIQMVLFFVYVAFYIILVTSIISGNQIANRTYSSKRWLWYTAWIATKMILFCIRNMHGFQTQGKLLSNIQLIYSSIGISNSLVSVHSLKLTNLVHFQRCLMVQTPLNHRILYWLAPIIVRNLWLLCSWFARFPFIASITEKIWRIIPEIMVTIGARVLGDTPFPLSGYGSILLMTVSAGWYLNKKCTLLLFPN